MYTQEEIEELCKEEETLTNETIIACLLSLGISIDDLEQEIRSFYSKYGKDGIVTYGEARKWVSNKNHLRRYIVLDQAVDGIVDVIIGAFDKGMEQGLRKVIQMEEELFGVKLDVNKILNTPWGADNLTWRQRLLSKTNIYSSKFKTELKHSFIRGDSIVDVISNLAKRGDSMSKDATRLIRSESNAISSIARKEIYNKLGVSRYRFVHLDRCDCEQCEDMDGRIFYVSEYEVGVTANPLHSNCRDTTEPIWE